MPPPSSGQVSDVLGPHLVACVHPEVGCWSREQALGLASNRALLASVGRLGSNGYVDSGRDLVAWMRGGLAHAQDHLFEQQSGAEAGWGALMPTAPS